MIKRIEQRRITGIPVEVIATPDNRAQLETTTDLSPQGAFIASSLPAHVGQTLICSFKFPDDPRDFAFFSRVAHVQTETEPTPARESGFGVEFMDISPYQRLQLREKLRQLQDDTSPLSTNADSDAKGSFWQSLRARIPIFGK